MLLQDLIVGVIVIGCGAYAAWTLMPAAARRRLAARMLAHALPGFLARPFRKALRPTGACGGCDGCGDAATAPPAKSARPVTFHRRLPR